MAQKDRASYAEVTSPRCVFQWPKLFKPDYGSDQFPIPDGAYSTKFVLKADDPATKLFLAKLRPAYDAAIAEAEQKFSEMKAEQRKKLGKISAQDFFTTLLDQETEEETGFISLSAKRKASGVYKKGPKAGQKWTAKLPIFNSKGIPVKGIVDCWGGTEGRVTVKPYHVFIPATGLATIGLELVSAQIIKLVAGQKDAKDYGFVPEEDGWDGEGGETEESGGAYRDETDSDAAKEGDF